MEMYHQPLVEVKLSARTKNTAARNSMRLRSERVAVGRTAMVTRAASAAPMVANAPKWWVHLVGLSAMNAMEIAARPTMRRAGPIATPGTRPLRNSIAAQVMSERNMASTANRRASEPSGVGFMSHS